MTRRGRGYAWCGGGVAALTGTRRHHALQRIESARGASVWLIIGKPLDFGTTGQNSFTRRQRPPGLLADAVD